MRRLHAVVVLGIVGLAAAGLAIAGLNNNSSIHLAGDFEVPARETNAQGQAIFDIADDGASVDYRLIGSNIENAFMAHIHCGSPTDNGGITVWLYPSTDDVAGPLGSGRHDGVLATGTIRDADVFDVPASTVCPGGIDDLADVIARLQNGGAYVNVHTNDGVAPTNTGAGDFPGGEIRGNAP